MADTRITPEEFLDISMSSYRRHLFKDLHRLSKRETLRPFVYFWRANFAKKNNKDCLLFIEEDDKKWAEVMEYMRDEERGDTDRIGAGVLKLFKTHDLDEDGDDDILVAIRSAHGKLKRNAVIDHFNNRLMDGNTDFFAILLGEVDDYTKAELKAEVPKRNKIRLKDFNFSKVEKALEDVEELEEYLEEFKQFLGSNTPYSLVGKLKQKIDTLELDLEESNDKGIPTILVQRAEQIDRTIDQAQRDLDPLIDDGMDYLDDLTFAEKETAEAFTFLIGTLNRIQILLSKLETRLEDTFGIPKD